MAPECQHQGTDSPRRVGVVSNPLDLKWLPEKLRFPEGQPLLEYPVGPEPFGPTRTAAPSQSSAQSVAVVLARKRFQSHSAPQPGPDGGLITPLAGTGGFCSPISRPSSSRLPSGKYS